MSIPASELKKQLAYKEELLTDVKNLVYRRTDDVERLQKVLEDTNKQLVDDLKKIKSLGEEKTKLQEELVELKTAAQAVVDLVDPAGSTNKQVLERLLEAPQKIVGYISDVTKSYLAHGLALVKSFWPKSPLEIIEHGVAADCPLEKFDEYLEELKPTAAKIIEGLEQE